MVKVINLAAACALHVKMTVAFFVADVLIYKTPAVAFDCSVNKTVFNELLHETVSCALTDSVFRKICDDFVNGESLFAVGLQKINQHFSLMSVIYFHEIQPHKIENNS